jgi:3'-phosphoadenosine 5'-phosphosulfate sulfotransferase (PAPS reductase)/FAD synthetase
MHENALPIVGTMASESQRRRTAWLKTGCNAFDSKKPMSKPISFFTEQDILRYIKEFDIPIAGCYGEIIKDKKGKFRCTGESRSGCCLCPVGVHLQKENKFIRLQKTHPELWEKGVRLGLPEVLDFVGVKY